MEQIDEGELLERAESLVTYLSEGGTLKGHFNISDEGLEAIYAVGYNHFSARKYEQAINLFKFLCLYDHTKPRWYYSLGVAQQQNNEYTAAINSYGVATLLDVDDPRPQAQAAYCLMALEKWDEALSALEGALMAAGEQTEYADVKQQCSAMMETVRSRLGSPVS